MPKILIIIAICFINNLFSIDFSPFNIELPGQDNPGLAVINFDLDEDLDILVSRNSTNEIILFENTGDWNNPIEHIVATDFDPQYLYAEDMNGDNYPDVIASSPIDGLVSIFYTNFFEETLYFEREDIANNITGAHRVIAEDIDSDGNMDIVCAAAGLGKILWWKKVNNLWIQNEVTNDFPGCQAISVYDMNGDTFLDVIGASMDNNEISIWYNSGTDEITWQKQEHSTSFVRAHWVSIADINNDNLPDVIGAAFTSDEISWWENDGQTSQSWVKHLVSNSINGAVTVEPAFLNNDNQVDLIATAWSSCKIYYWIQNNGDFNRHLLASYQWGAWPIAVGDFDNDSDIDFFVGCDVLNADAISNPLTLWLNNSIVSNVYNEVQNLSDILVYPNPTQNNINIKFGKEEEISKIDLYNIKGQKIKQISVFRKTKEFRLSTKELNLSNGLYFFKISTDSGFKITKFLHYK